MDFVNPVNSHGKDPTVKKEWGKRVLIWSLSILGVLLLLLLLLPTLLSTQATLSWVVTQANTALAPATVEVESISLAWFQEQHITGIRYSDPAHGVEATVKEITLSSLRDLLPVRKITVNCTVDTPEVALSAPQPPPGLPLLEAETAEEVLSDVSPQIHLPAWNIAINLTVQKGRLTHEAVSEPLLSNLACTLSIPDITAAPTLSLNTALLDGTLTAKTQLKPLETLLTTPVVPFTTAELAFAADWTTFELTAGPLPERIYPGGTLALTLPCNKLLHRLQTLNLHLPEELKNLSGVLTLKGTLETAATADTFRLSTALQAKNLTGTVNGKQLTLSPSFNLIAEFNPEKMIEGRIERLSADLPGFMASGYGSLQSGTLAAQADLQTLFDTLQPFIGDMKLPKPITVNLSATATSNTLKLSTTAKSAKDELATFTINGEGVNLASRAVASLKTTLQADLAKLTPFFPLPAGQSLTGTLYFNTSLTGSLTNWQAKGLTALRSVTFDSASWQVNEPSLLEGSFNCTFTESTGLKWSDISLTTPFATAKGSFETNRLICSGTLNPQKVLACQKKPAGLRLDGEPHWQLAATLDTLTAFNFAVTADPFALTLPENVQITLPVTAKLSGTISAEAVNLTSYTFMTPYLALDGKGTFDIETKHLLTSGMFTPDFDRLWALPFCDFYREAGFALSGRHTHPFTFDLPLENGVDGILNYGKGQATIAFDKITIPGLDIPNGQASMTLNDAVATLDGTFSVNNGTVSLQPSLNLAEKPLRLTFPETSYIFKDIALTQQLLDTCLPKVNPLLSGTVVPGGTVALLCNACTFTFDDPLGSLDANFTFQTQRCSFNPTGNLNILINLLRLTHRAVALPDQDFTIDIEQGALTCDKVELDIPPAKLTCSGSTNLKTGEVDYLVQLPLTEQLLGRRISKYLALDQTLKLPIAGSTHKPILDTGPLLKFLRESAIGIGVGKLSSRAGKILEKTGEIGLEIGGAASDTIKTGGQLGVSAVETLDSALHSLFRKKEKKKEEK